MAQNNNSKVTNRRLIEETHKAVTQLQTVLLGIPGTDDRGLVGEVKSVKSDVNSLYTKHRKLSLRVWFLIIILVTSGVISFGELSNLINIFG